MENDKILFICVFMDAILFVWYSINVSNCSQVLNLTSNIQNCAMDRTFFTGGF